MAAEALTDEAKAKVTRIKQLIDNGDYNRAISSEGGTGMIKLRRIVSIDHPLDFGFTVEGKFYVEFQVRVEKRGASNEGSNN